MRIELLIIDPQNDFCWPGIHWRKLETSSVKASVVKVNHLVLVHQAKP